jgi:hypothetical protein
LTKKQRRPCPNHHDCPISLLPGPKKNDIEKWFNIIISELIESVV